MTNRILNNMVEISRLAGSLQWQYKRNLHLRKENRIRLIQSSLAIENNSLTVEQVTDLVNGKRVLGDPKEIREVQNAYEAYEEIMGYNPYAVRDFLKAHKLLTKGLVRLSGRFRSKDVGVFASDGLLPHMGVRPELIPDLMKALFRWAKTDDTPLLVKSTVVHYEIEVIHPFEDGNGRMGRLWQSVLLSRWNPLFAWLPVETIVYRNQPGYYRVLAEADRANNSTVFIEFMLDMILETLQTYRTDGISDKISGKTSGKKQAIYDLILHHLQTHAHISNSQLQMLTGKSPATVRKYLADLVSEGLLEAEGENKQRVYRLSGKKKTQD